jgi:penicillin amidase
VDLSPANNRRFIDAVGQSGHFLSRHYDDFMTDWRDVRDRKMRLTRAEIDEGALGRLVLTPAATN